MKTGLLLTLIILFLSDLVYSQEKDIPKDMIKSKVVVKMTFVPFLFETVVSGYFDINQQKLSFTPSPCSEIDKKYSSVFPCNNHLINKIDLNFSDIAKISRRSYLFIVPNRIFIKKVTGETYLFITSKRRHIINAYKKYRLENSSIDPK
ncbi:hypothetical protein [Spirosoma fluviale]|uniref:GRAM domain-containing protein n=1 Tax=Spirosoma fluviale TaxID=1597977 RepID=A0A286G8F5_9BACT|nr:hypothetical protein [Spirosoma fluviale]SOD91742.1 hypothetical protein SAMN06269250_3617 [Spirosoma fluviale]